MNCNSRMCNACKYVYDYISKKMLLEREKIIEKIFMEQNEMLYKKFMKIIMIHNEVDHKISLFELMGTTEMADQMYEVCCEEKVFRESRDIIEGLEYLRKKDLIMNLK